MLAVDFKLKMLIIMGKISRDCSYHDWDLPW